MMLLFVIMLTNYIIYNGILYQIDSPTVQYVKILFLNHILIRASYLIN